MSSALWVCWGLLCGHLVAFKAPKSWPNKFLINVWGGFSVIFVASYTANIAALIAGLFFHSATATYHDNSVSMSEFLS
jgi:ionotropic glutamate receptor NMDA 3A